ncbi:hypothetical protein L6R46_15805 [Myxococcota bacterium]|nr:hypothetical protein [Myxococcota bacterium]
MRAFVIAAFTFVVGLVLGGVGPRAEVAELQEQIEDLEDNDCGPGLRSELAQLLAAGAGRRAPTPPADPALKFGDPEEIAAKNPEVAEAVAEGEAAREEVGAGMSEAAREVASDAEGLQAARTALELRRAQARQALVEGAEPSDAQLERIDAAVDTMNASLSVLADELVATLESGEEPSRRDAMAFAADALDTLINAEDQIYDSLSPEQREAVDEGAIDPFSYVDPALVDKLGALSGAGGGQP